MYVYLYILSLPLQPCSLTLCLVFPLSYNIIFLRASLANELGYCNENAKLVMAGSLVLKNINLVVSYKILNLIKISFWMLLLSFFNTRFYNFPFCISHI